VLPHRSLRNLGAMGVLEELSLFFPVGSTAATRDRRPGEAPKQPPTIIRRRGRER